MSEKPWWEPELTDEKWVAQMREDIPEDTEGMGADEIREEYQYGRKYAVYWDHIGDAYEQFEALADAYFALRGKP